MEIDPGPQPARRGPSWASPTLAASLAVLLLGLVAAVAVLPGLNIGFGAGSDNQPTPSPTTAAGLPSPSPTITFVRPTPTPVPTPLIYFVKSGDSLISIAKEFGTTARSIAYWNRDRYPSLDPDSEGYAPDRIGVGWTFSLIPNAVYDEQAQPSLPVTGQSPAPDSSAPATPLPGGPAAVLSRGPSGSDQVAMTFDMGDRLDPAIDILDWLVEHRVKATIFVPGELGSTNEIGREALRIVRAHPDLFDLGNGSWDGTAFTDLGASAMSDQLWRTEEALTPLGGGTTRPWFRPPFGAWTRAVREGVGAAGWRYIVMWDVDTFDWRPPSEGGPTADDIEAKVLASAGGGSIVRLHLGGWNTLEALPDLVDGLRAKGLRPVTLDEMVGG